MVQLKWQKPEKDGGRPILHYVVEQKDKFSDWTEVRPPPLSGADRNDGSHRTAAGWRRCWMVFAFGHTDRYAAM